VEKPNRRFQILIGLVIALFAYGTVRWFYYGSLTRSCIYTEEVKSLQGKYTDHEVLVTQAVSVIDEAPLEYQCLSILSSIKKQFRPTQFPLRNDDGSPMDPSKVSHFDRSMKLKLVQLISVKKHGITTMDSGSGPIHTLILSDSNGTLYQVPHVFLGLNSGEEFLKLKTPTEEIMLRPEMIPGELF
jgi:hypothetical protein